MMKLIIPQNMYDQIKCGYVLVLKNCIKQTCLCEWNHKENTSSGGNAGSVHFWQPFLIYNKDFLIYAPIY